MALGDVLRRFRFHGVPGAPIAVGVPGDRTAELEAELAPVFWALEEVQRQTAELVAAAEHQVDHRRSNVIEQGRRLVTQARHEMTSCTPRGVYGTARSG